jgi:hypothetical protein
LSRLTITFINKGHVPITVEKLGLEVKNSDTIIMAKWDSKRTILPARLQFGEKAFAIYVEDEIRFEPTMADVTSAIVVTASNRTIRNHNTYLRRWRKLARRRAPI